jgi:hypothetical protein
MITNTREKIDGFHGTFVDKNRNSCHVKGTFALGPILSWHTDDGHWVEIDGYDQGYTIPQEVS